jgi:MFS family permease
MARPLFLDKNLLIIFGVTLTAVLGVSSLMPILPELPAAFGVSRAAVALVVTAFTLPGVLLAPVSGVLADRYGRKIVLVAALLIFSVFGSACAFADDIWTLAALRTMQGAGAAPLGILNMTLVGDLFSGLDRAKAMGYTSSILAIGAAAFPALGGLLSLLGWRAVFLLPSVAAPLALLVFLFLDEPARGESEPFMNYLKNTAKTLCGRKALGLFAITLLTFMILYGCYVTYLPVLLRVKLHASSLTIGAVVSAASAFTAIAASQSGRLNTLFSPIALMCAAFVFYAASLALLPHAASPWLSILAVTLFGLGQGLNIPNLMGMLTGLAPVSKRAAVMAINGSLLRMGQTLGPLFMGVVYAGLGLNLVFYAGAALVAAMFIVLQCIVVPATAQGETP